MDFDLKEEYLAENFMAFKLPGIETVSVKSIFVNKSLKLKKWGATTMESDPQYIYILQSFVFSRENSKLSSVLSVHSCYKTWIAHTFHINGI